MVKRAQNSKPPIGRLADVISAYFVPVVMIISIVSALAWLNFALSPLLPLQLCLRQRCLSSRVRVR